MNRAPTSILLNAPISNDRDTGVGPFLFIACLLAVVQILGQGSSRRVLVRAALMASTVLAAGSSKSVMLPDSTAQLGSAADRMPREISAKSPG